MKKKTCVMFKYSTITNKAFLTEKTQENYNELFLLKIPYAMLKELSNT